MKSTSFFFVILFCGFLVSTKIYSQAGFSVSPHDTTLCAPDSVTFHAIIPGGSGNTIGVSTLPDDGYSGVLPIGFTFNYFGVNYTQCLISSNGIISFDITQANGFCQWSISNPIPSASNPMNCIMCAWQDLYPPGAPPAVPPGVVTYGTYGTAPNRVFMMCYDNMPYFYPTSSCPGFNLCSAIAIYETTNIIESFIVNKGVCTAWNGGAAIHGIQNANGTIAFVVPGRNFPTQWTCTKDAWRFTPTSATNYTVAAIPFVPPVAGAIGSISWYNFAGTLIGNGTNYTQFFANNDSLICRWGSCGVYSYDTVHVLIDPLTATVSSHAPLCNSSFDGSITVVPTGTTPPWTVTYVDSATGSIVGQHPGVSVADSLGNLGIGTFIIHVTTALGCNWSDTVRFFAVTPTATFTDAPVTICAGSPVQFTSTTLGNVIAYNWNFGDNSTALIQNPSHAYAQGGTYIVQYVSFFPGGCSDTAFDTLFVWDNIVANFTYAPLNICNGDTVHFTDHSSQNPIAWSWNLDDNANAATQNSQHAYSANPKTNNLYNITLTVTDSLCGVSSYSLPINVFYNPQPFIGRDTNICPGEEVMLDAGYAGNSFVWSNGLTTQNITVPFEAIGQYSVIVNNNGCLGYDTLNVGMECDLFMVNAFTPNGDGLNDIFHPGGDKVSSFKMWLYNRWGEQVFYIESNNILEGWDGKHNGIESEMGTYVYQIEAKFRNGGSTTQKGNVTLIR